MSRRYWQGTKGTPKRTELQAKAVERSRTFRQRNRERLREYFADYRAANREKLRARFRNYKAQRKGAPGSFSDEDVRALFEMQRGCCFWCASPLDAYHIDHVVPISKGGTNNRANLVLACPFCNISKGDRLPEEWPQNPGLRLSAGALFESSKEKVMPWEKTA